VADQLTVHRPRANPAPCAHPGISSCCPASPTRWGIPYPVVGV